MTRTGLAGIHKKDRGPYPGPIWGQVTRRGSCPQFAGYRCPVKFALSPRFAELLGKLYACVCKFVGDEVDGYMGPSRSQVRVVYNPQSGIKLIQACHLNQYLDSIAGILSWT